jgi:hypothetical protein
MKTKVQLVLCAEDGREEEVQEIAVAESVEMDLDVAATGRWHRTETPESRGSRRVICRSEARASCAARQRMTI